MHVKVFYQMFYSNIAQLPKTNGYKTIQKFVVIELWKTNFANLWFYISTQFSKRCCGNLLSWKNVKEVGRQFIQFYLIGTCLALNFIILLTHANVMLHHTTCCFQQEPALSPGLSASKALLAYFVSTRISFNIVIFKY